MAVVINWWKFKSYVKVLKEAKLDGKERKKKRKKGGRGGKKERNSQGAK